jgi:hypothetical protein
VPSLKLYRPVAGEPDAYRQLTPALTRPIRWELIALAPQLGAAGGEGGVRDLDGDGAGGLRRRT